MSESLDEKARYGFRWGPAAIWRIAEVRRNRFLGIDTERHSLEVGISPAGNSIRVWLDGVPLVPLNEGK